MKKLAFLNQLIDPAKQRPAAPPLTDEDWKYVHATLLESPDRAFANAYQ